MSRWTTSLARFWQRTYAGDYIALIVLLAVFILIEILVEPFHRMFSLDDRSKAYPHAVLERVPVFWLFVYAGALPVLTFLCYAVILQPGWHTMHVTLLGYIEAVLLTLVVTDIVKNAVGRGRPDLIARCKPRIGAPAHELVTFEICTETDHHVLHDGWRSFPSGHSSFAFAGLGYMSFFVAGQFRVLRPRTDLFRFMVFIVPLMGAALIAISRLADYRHDVYDVTAGTVLGVVVAYLCYRRYFRNLRHSKCEIPYRARAELVKDKNEGRIRDEEQLLRREDDFELQDAREDSDSDLSSRTGNRGGRRAQQ